MGTRLHPLSVDLALSHVSRATLKAAVLDESLALTKEEKASAARLAEFYRTELLFLQGPPTISRDVVPDPDVRCLLENALAAVATTGDSLSSSDISVMKEALSLLTTLQRDALSSTDAARLLTAIQTVESHTKDESVVDNSLTIHTPTS